jgi:hypothetical protein
MALMLDDDAGVCKTALRALHALVEEWVGPERPDVLPQLMKRCVEVWDKLPVRISPHPPTHNHTYMTLTYLYTFSHICIYVRFLFAGLARHCGSGSCIRVHVLLAGQHRYACADWCVI